MVPNSLVSNHQHKLCKKTISNTNLIKLAFLIFLIPQPGNIDYYAETEAHELKKWTPVIGQRLDEYKCFLQNEPCAQERNDEKTKTKPFI